MDFPVERETSFLALFLWGMNCGTEKYLLAVQDTPWKVILSSYSVWATAMSSFSQSFATVGMVTYIPLYYRTVLRMNLTAVSFLLYYLLFYFSDGLFLNFLCICIALFYCFWRVFEFFFILLNLL